MAYPERLRARAMELDKRGIDRKQIAALLGISKVTLHNWLPNKTEPPKESSAQHGDKIRELWVAGLSSGKIVKELGGRISRNAVMGYICRARDRGERWADMRKTPDVVAMKAAMKAEKPKSKVLFTPAVEPQRVYAPDGLAPLHRLSEDTGTGCRWIEGDPKHTTKATVCGHAVHSGAWCEHHFFRVYPGAADAAKKKRERAA